MLRVDRSIIFQVINFAALVFLLFRFLFKPVVKALDARSNYIRGELERIEEEKRLLEEERKKLEEELKNLKAKYLEMLDQANKEAQRIKETIIQEAYREAERIKRDYERRAQREIERIFAKLREDVVDISEEVVKKILKVHITPEVQTQIIEDMLEEAVRRLEAEMEIAHEG
ncbi:MAG: F0F1 ATP synthase subunit B [Candidatus Caldatribacterium sp.]|uniref:F0F1 ATP synthase subunit B n=1 Tax=Candidatus Caldatribacterium sp. TaxID=2282143 RepID=UPI002991D7FC|nr:F0F1 ATP synthase subunit B [Candidatus Caldatribacterium sp.]MCX7731265.1 F0F1 ATP synthase subunit B [Candidatus Caldatribacterium sp.]MDW8081465.1 F0F1 ATP synthase subunit B [Candidatus Calescibacterium sp.]